MTEQDLLNLKKAIEKTKSEINELEGRKKYLAQQLKSDWKCSNLKQAKKKLASFEKQADDLEAQIKEKTTELETTYEFEDENI